jgi:hypothetical protein
MYGLSNLSLQTLQIMLTMNVSVRDRRVKHLGDRGDGNIVQAVTLTSGPGDSWKSNDYAMIQFNEFLCCLPRWLGIRWILCLCLACFEKLAAVNWKGRLSGHSEATAPFTFLFTLICSVPYSTHVFDSVESGCKRDFFVACYSPDTFQTR